MRPTALLVLLLPAFVRAVTTKKECNHLTLVRCFITVLDEWTWALYELKDNVVTINSEQCKHLKTLEKCVNDELGEEATRHMCEHHEVVEASEVVSDLFTHRKNSGSFLKSYYLLRYSCTPEGQLVLNEHRECLRKEKIGEMTLAAGTYLTDKFLKDGTPDVEVCSNLQGKINEYVNSMSGLCKNEAAQIMCKSLINMFMGLHVDKVTECDLRCPQLENPTDEPSVNVPQEIPNDQEAQQGPAKAANPAAALLASLASTLVLLLR